MLRTTTNTKHISTTHRINFSKTAITQDARTPPAKNLLNDFKAAGVIGEEDKQVMEEAEKGDDKQFSAMKMTAPEKPWHLRCLWCPKVL